MRRFPFNHKSIYVKATLNRLFSTNKFQPTFINQVEVNRIIKEEDFWLTLLEIHDKINQKGIIV